MATRYPIGRIFSDSQFSISTTALQPQTGVSRCKWKWQKPKTLEKSGVFHMNIFRQSGTLTN
jgi:hypothetical protein